MNKFPVQVASGQMIGFDKDRFTQMLRTAKDGDYEILFRKKVDWNTDQMRKYFHGPVLEFIREQFKVLGSLYSKGQVKEFLKSEYGDKDKMSVPLSTSAYDRDRYIKFLKDINLWCIECFECELPPSEEVE